MSDEDFGALLVQHLAPRYQVCEHHIQQLTQHFRLLREWNRRINLTGISDVEEVVLRHYCESIALAFALPPGNLRIIDAGSGAGFPGIPIAIVRPNCLVHLVESDRRKSVFLREAVAELANCIVIPQRIEQVFQECDWLVARAVRWEEIIAAGERLADHIALMVSSSTAKQLEELPQVHWQPQIQIPWAQQNVLLLGAFR